MDKLAVKSQRWGWYIDLSEHVEMTSFSVYAGAGQNDISKGTYIGTVELSIANGKYEISFEPVGNHYITNSHLGVYTNLKDLEKTNLAPGKFTNIASANKARYIVIHFDAMVAQ